MTDLTVEKAAEQVEISQVEIQRAMGSLEDSLTSTTQKVSQMIGAMRKYPGLVWVVAGAIGVSAAIDFFSNRIDSRSTRGYNPLGNPKGSDRA